MNIIPELNLPKSPLTDEQFKYMLAWLQQSSNLTEMLDGMERTKAFPQEQIDASRQQLNDNITKVTAVIKEFAKHHGY